MPEPNERILTESIPPSTNRPVFITPEMIERNPLLKHAGVFANDPLWDEVIAAIKRNRMRQRRVRRTESK